MTDHPLLPKQVVNVHKTNLSICQAQCHQKSLSQYPLLVGATPDELAAIQHAWTRMADNFWRAYRVILENEGPASEIERIARDIEARKPGNSH